MCHQGRSLGFGDSWKHAVPGSPNATLALTISLCYSADNILYTVKFTIWWKTDEKPDFSLRQSCRDLLHLLCHSITCSVLYIIWWSLLLGFSIKGSLSYWLSCLSISAVTRAGSHISVTLSGCLELYISNVLVYTIPNANMSYTSCVVCGLQLMPWMQVTYHNMLNFIIYIVVERHFQHIHITLMQYYHRLYCRYSSAAGLTLAWIVLGSADLKVYKDAQRWFKHCFVIKFWVCVHCSVCLLNQQM